MGEANGSPAGFAAQARIDQNPLDAFPRSVHTIRNPLVVAASAGKRTETLDCKSTVRDGMDCSRSVSHKRFVPGLLSVVHRTAPCIVSPTNACNTAPGSAASIRAGGV